MKAGPRSGVVLAATALALSAVFADEPARWLVVEDPPQAADAALVLAGDPNYERTRTAARLFLEGRVRFLIVTGGEPGPGDSADSLRDVALAAGVPQERIRLERTSRSTREALVAVREIVTREGVTVLALVTSPYHQRRAFLAARRAFPGIRIVNRPARPASWRPEGWWRHRFYRRIVFGEYLKTVYYTVRGWI